jgi:hypothetical protein
MLTFYRDALSTVMESNRRPQPIESTLANPGPPSRYHLFSLVYRCPRHLPARAPPIPTGHPRSSQY